MLYTLNTAYLEQLEIDSSKSSILYCQDAAALVNVAQNFDLQLAGLDGIVAAAAVGTIAVSLVYQVDDEVSVILGLVNAVDHLGHR